MDIDDKELFSSAMTDDSTPEVTEAPEAQPEQQDGRTRDDHGRFAARQSEPAPQPEPAAPDQGQAKDEANVPSWRLREVREEAERRVAEANAQWQRQFEMLQRQSQPKPEPTPRPDLFENPDGAIEYGVRTALTPLEERLQAQEARLQSQVEWNSRMYAEQVHGPEKVRAAYNWIAEKVQQRDPDVMHIYQQVMQSAHPYDAIVAAHQKVSVMQQISQVGDIDKWVIQRAQELAGAQQQQGRQQSNGQPQGSITKLPPSLRNTPSARSGNDDDNSDTSDAALFRHAMR
jgi:hypothetical protein